MRLGKYQAGASKDDKATLFRAVANIAGDCAAIIPESMTIEFIEAGNVGASHALYKERADWIDQQISKAVLGQTATTDAVTGGLGSGKEHRQVQEDIERADAKALAAILNRDLVRIWVQMEYGPRKVYPRLRIGRAADEDLKALSDALTPMIDRGMAVDMADLRRRFSLPEPKAGAELLRPAGAGPALTDPAARSSEIKRVPGEIKRGAAPPGMVTAPQAPEGLAGIFGGSGETDPATVLADRLALEAAAPMAAMIGQLMPMLEAAESLEEFRVMMLAAFPKLDAGPLAKVIAQARVVAWATGRADAVAEGG